MFFNKHLKIQLFFCFTALFANPLISQSFSRIECDNFNSYRFTDVDSLKVISVTPAGVIKPRRSDENDIETKDFFTQLGLPTHFTFVKTRDFKSRVQENQWIEFYQQYYKEIKVEGGGFSAMFINDGPDRDPCLQAASLYPSIYQNIEIDINDKKNLNEIIQQNSINDLQIRDSEIAIAHNILGDCSFTLIYKINVIEENAETIVIDAITGIELKRIQADMHIDAPTEDYGVQFMDDRIFNGLRLLERADTKLATFDADQRFFSEFIADAENFINKITCSDSQIAWTQMDAATSVFQTHYFASKVIDYYDSNLAIEFNNVKLIANCQDANAFVPIFDFEQNLNTSVVVFGTRFLLAENSTYGELDVIAHELAHVFMQDILPYNESTGENPMIQEAVADFFAIFIEYAEIGEIDWVVGNDVPFSNLRDFQNLPYVCFDDESLNDYQRGNSVRRWFYLITTGEGTQKFTGIGIETAIEIVLGALEHHQGTISDYDLFSAATISYVEDNYDLCSNVQSAVKIAWEMVCVIEEYEICNFWINGPSYVCEETDYLHMCIEGGLEDSHYKLTIIGPQSTDFDVQGSTTGNGTELNENCIIINSFPLWNYYPQRITFKVSSPTNSNHIAYHDILFHDCDGDDPSCEEYYELGEMPSVESSLRENLDVFHHYKVFDHYGNDITYLTNDSNPLTFDYSGLLFIIYYDQGNEIVNIKKIIKVQ